MGQQKRQPRTYNIAFKMLPKIAVLSTRAASVNSKPPAETWAKNFVKILWVRRAPSTLSPLTRHARPPAQGAGGGRGRWDGDP